MNKLIRLLSVVLCLGLVQQVLAQDDEAYYESLLNEEVKVENPVYLPVLGISFGTLNFYGDVHNNVRNPFVGTPGYRVNAATFIDNKHFLRANFYFMLGTLVANQRSYTDTALNRNFSSNITSFGLNLQFNFENFIKENKNKVKINPFVSLGIEDIQFNSKTDTSDIHGNHYYYWTDGTIRNIPEKDAGVMPSKILQRSYNYYPTDLRALNNGTYASSTFSIPISIGIDFTITDRINLRIGEELHYTFTKNIDNMAWLTGHANKMMDKFTYSYISLHFDLFSSAKTILVHKLFAEVDNFDYAMFGDEDNDGVYDIYDKCPGTPFGVAVDSVGCPYDTDNDGVPDYLDKEPNTAPGAMVDEDGVTIKPEVLAEKINIDAVDRKDVDAFLLMHRAQSRYKGKPSIPLPEKFKQVDLDGDGYISFDELIKAIDDFFDSSSKLTTKDIYELQDFFFDQ